LAGPNTSEESKKKRRFNKFLVEAIINSMDFGEVVLHFIELNSPVRRDEIAEKPEVFAAELEGIFGDNSTAIEERIIKNLYSTIGIEYRIVEGYKIQDYIKHALKEYLKK